MIKCKFQDLFDKSIHDTGGMQINKGLDSLFAFKAKNAGLNYDIKTRLLKAVNERLAEFTASLTELQKSYAINKEVEFEDGKKEKTNLRLIDVPKLEEKKAKHSKENTEQKLNLIISVNNKSVKTKEVLGQIIDTTSYDVPKEKIEEMTKQINELLETEIELSCYPIKLSKLNAEEDTSSIAFEYLDLFINNDVE